MSPTIALGADHGGFAAKEALKAHLTAAGHVVLDLGAASAERCDYPDFAAAVARAVAGGQARFGVLICGTGIGMAMTANRRPGVRAAVIQDAFSAAMCREHNDANVICFGARILAVAAMERLLAIFLSTDFAKGRHAPRVAKIEAAVGD